MERQYFGWAHVEEKDPISGEVTHASYGYDGPFATMEEALSHAREVATANRHEPDLYAAYAECEEHDENGNTVRTYRDEK